MRRVLSVLGAAVLVAGTASATPSIFPTGGVLLEYYAQLQPKSEKGMSAALRAKIDRAMETIPAVDDAERGMGSTSRSDWKLEQLVSGGEDISLTALNLEKKAYNNAKKRGFPKGKGKPGQWVSVGPSYPFVPFNPYRDTTVYLPNQGASSGRTVALAISPSCAASYCRVWAAAAGGGIWRTDKALAGTPVWKYLSSPFEINSIGTVVQDPNDASGNTLWVGTGESNSSGDSVRGVGLYKTTDGGNTWTGPFGKSVFAGRGVGAVAVAPGAPNVIYAGSTRAVSGLSSVSGGAVTITVPGAANWGLYKSTDDGATWTYIHDGSINVSVCAALSASALSTSGTCSQRGVRRVAVDPVDPNVVYAASFGRGIWRSPDAGATWAQLRAPNSTSSSNRTEFAITLLGSGDTRMYVGDGFSSSGGQHFYRSDSVRTGVASFTQLSSSSPANPGYGAYAVCTGQCVYDNYVYTPPGYPDIVYLLGSFTYGENDPFGSEGWISNGRGVVLSQDAGVNWTDQTYDATDFIYPNALHPDQHGIVTNPSNPFQWFESNDGGVYRSSGVLVDNSAQCNLRALYDPVIAGDAAKFARCQQLLSAIPSFLEPINKNLPTLQFQSLSVNPFDPDDLQGGTQDNGTWESYGNPTKWINTDIGDGGQSGFDVGNPNLRFHTFFYPQVFVSDASGDPLSWNWISDRLGAENGFVGGNSFYPPVINDPVVSGTLFIGKWSVWRTKTYGFGPLTSAELTTACNLWTGDASFECGDWEPLGAYVPAGGGASDLTWTFYGGDRLSAYVAAVERAPGDSSTVWAATSGGRVFVSKNGDADPASSVTWARIDGLSAVDPARFVTGIFVDPADPNHAWLTYSGFNLATPTTPGHIFSVTYDPIGGTASWTNLDGTLASGGGDLPLNDVVYDDVKGALYVSCDFGVLASTDGGVTWGLAAPGMPAVEVPGLTILPASRRLYAATHGQSAWRLNLP